MSIDRTAAFRQKYESLAGRVHIVEDEDGALQIVTDVVQDVKAARIALALESHSLAAGVAERMGALGVEVLATPFRNEGLEDALDGADVGLTDAQFGVVEAGALVELSTDDATRLVSTLPRTHICMLQEANLLDTLLEAGPPIRAFLAANPLNAAVTFISGPSRTADIEMKLTLGVHGPERAEVIIVRS